MKRYLSSLLLFLLLSPAYAQFRLGQQPLQTSPSLDYGNPQKYEIGGITISGVKFLDENALISITGLKVGDQITVPGEEISNAIKKLWDQGILGDIEVNVTKVEGNYIFLDFYMKERPRLSRFNFKGARKSDISDLRDKINLIRGRVITDALVKNAQNTVRKYYMDKGFLNVEVNITQQDDTILSNSASLLINVDRGNKVKVNTINIAGNEEFSNKLIRRKLKETKQKNAWRFWKPSKYTRANFEEDKEKLIAYYNAQGYRDAAIVSDTVYRHDEETINIDMTIYEGTKYYFRDITWTGNYVYDDEVLQRVLSIEKGDVYNLETLQKRLQFNPTGLDVSSLYLDDGYLFFNVDPVEVRVEGDSIDIEMRITEGAQADIKTVNVTGNTKTSDHVILREIRTLPGQKFSRTALIRSQRELAQLGYFDPEQIGINPVPNPADGTVDINYTVVERPSDQIELSGGWGGYYGFVGTLGVTFNNFSLRNAGKLRNWRPLPAGDGQRLSVRMQASGRSYQTYSLSFMEPWLGGKQPNAFSVNLSHSNQNIYQNVYDVRSPRTGGLGITSISLGLGRRLRFPDDYFSLNNSLTFQRYALDNYTYARQFGLSVTDGNYNSVVLNSTLSRNSIDQPTFPTSGSSLTLSVSLTPPYSLLLEDQLPSDVVDPIGFNNRWLEYHKWMFDASWFIPLAKKLVINTRAHMGFIGNYNSALAITPFERFVMGGSGISGFNFLVGRELIGLRGYQDNQIVPYNPKTGQTDNGVIYNKFVTELRYAISTNPSATIFVLAFAEGGNNWGTYKDYNPFTLYRSAGVGARIFMPAFGMIGIDYGKAFDGPKSLHNAFTFTIGQQIR
ncbi:outer membrane protein insertion porin family [Catalinimonas alkaloidigena]|uniref:Outer membrane protein assembly factor BamA n=1 Tax=Catalinimonas alkaloidigena TaxID=1075417 RepID=A0A1G9DV68_9BACT|nr:outer membrane protein assembly factor BamA [Catalinimonas alkaloidigena]SDK67738.1 outer membrane protein insertion porin family [Catalinimonas alkaloidigena]